MTRYYVYVLVNACGKTYVGQTADLDRRLAQHNDPSFRGTLYTKRHAGPWRLLHGEEFSLRRDAMVRERQLKTAKGREWVKGQLLGGC